jgi:predicted RNase H-like HicB family nuclease
MKHYVSVLVPSTSGRWHAFFPDLPDCEADGSSLDLTVMHAARALAHYAETLNGEIWVAPPPRELADIRSDETWSAAHAVNWRSSVITMIPLRA